MTIQLTMAWLKLLPNPLSQDLPEQTNCLNSRGRVSTSTVRPIVTNRPFVVWPTGVAALTSELVVTVTPGGVCTRALLSRLLTNWWRWACSPRLYTGLSGR